MTTSPQTAPVAYRRLMTACGVAMLAFAASIAVPSICLREIGAEFNLDFAQRGLLASARMTALLVALLLSGLLAERFGSRRFLTGGLILAGAGLLVTANANGYAALVAAQALAGMGTGALEALVNPLIALLNPRSAARHLNVLNGVFSVGLVVGALATGLSLQGGTPWRWTFLAWAPVALFGAALFASRRYPVRPQEHGEPSHWREFLRNPLFWLLVAAMVIGGGFESGMTVWGANFVEHELGATAMGGAWTIALFGAFMALGRFGSGALVARVHPLTLMMVSAVAGAVGTVPLYFVSGLTAAWGLFAVGGLCVACFWPTILAVASDTIEVGSSSLFALLAAAGISGCVIFPWAIGAIGDAFGLRAGVILLPVSMVVQVGVLLVFGALARRPGRAYALTESAVVPEQ